MRGSKLSLLFTPALMLSFFLLPVAFVDAAPVVGFKAGNIIDDTVMTDHDSMTTTEIQNFLNSKVPTCDTNGSQNSEMNNSGVPDYNNNGSIQRWEWGKKKYNQTTFTCLKNYSKDGKSAARIIRDAAHEFTISPKVLLVLLQKEQGLVTDTWPTKIQYRSATGYGCPDTAPCNSEYYGLKNQVRWAARMFRAILDDSPSWYTPYNLGNNQIRWNPQASCGSSTVDIQNRATQALYNYTPYRPNQAALNAGYGTGNACSSYGNRNFYLYFTDWFGSTSAPLFKITGGGETIYLNHGDNYYSIPSMDVLRAWGLDNKKIKIVESTHISSYTQGPALALLTKFGASDTIYLVDNGKRISIPDMDMFDDYDFNVGNVRTYTDSNLINSLPSNGSLKSLVRDPGGGIYFVEDGEKRVFPDYETFSTLGPSLAGGSLSYTNISAQFINGVTEGSPVLLDGKFVKAKNTAAIYLHDGNELYWLSSEAWKSWGKSLDYGGLSSTSLAQIPSASTPAPILVTDGSTNYLVNDGKKHRFTPTTQNAWDLVNGDFTQVSALTLARLGTGPNVSTLLRSSVGTVYTLRNNEKLPVASMDDFTGLGYSWNEVRTLSNNALNLVPTSTSFALSPKSLVRLPSGGIYWIDSNFAMHSIASMDMFVTYGFSTKAVRQLGQNDALSAYTNTSLQHVAEGPSGTYHLIDRGKRLSISTSAYSSAQYDFSGTTKVSLSTSLVNSLNAGPALTQFVQGSTATVYKVVNGEKRPIPNPTVLFAQGGSWSTITKVSDSFLETLPTGTSY